MKKKLLIIEDDKVVASIYSNKFRSAGYVVLHAGDGETGVQAVVSQKPDIIVLDLGLPKMNGVQVLKKIRSDPESARTPVVVFTNAYQSNLVQDAWTEGANDCVVKANCTPTQLMETVNRVMREHVHTTAYTPEPPPAAAAPAPMAAPAPAPAAQPAPARPVAREAFVTSNREQDDAFQAELRKSFTDSAKELTTQLRANLQSITKADSDATRIAQLHELYRKVHSLTGNAAMAGLPQIARTASALEALLKEIYEKPTAINPSTMRTIAHTIDFLALLLDHCNLTMSAELPQSNILVLDDENLSRRAVIYALDKAGLKCVSVEDPHVALTMIEENKFDLIFLDIDMPKMDGLELCTRIRSYGKNLKTPVIFVTSLSDFENRARSTLAGGNDLVGKPFMFMEVAVKALTHVMKAQLDAALQKQRGA